MIRTTVETIAGQQPVWNLMQPGRFCRILEAALVPVFKVIIEDDDKRFLLKINKDLPNSTASHPRRY
jgi:hypothetical protein